MLPILARIEVWTRPLLQTLRRHWIAGVVALCVGFLSIFPQVAFILSLGERYQGIPMLQTPNEAAYLSIMQEIRDGHPSAASVPFFEYKDALPLLPSILALPYAYLAALFGTSIASVLIASKFVLPAALFLLVYAFMIRASGGSAAAQTLLAVSSGLFVTLGFDLVDYRSMLDFLRGAETPANFLIWTRPVNPISGALLLFVFLLCLWQMHTNGRKRLTAGIAGLSLALMMASYVFSWTLALAVLGVQGAFALARKEWERLVSLVAIVCVGVVFSLPYWAMVFKAAALPWYAEAAARVGLLATHAPHWNKFVIFSLLVFAAISFFYWYREKRCTQSATDGTVAERVADFGLGWWFSLSLFLGSFLVYIQQVITGKEIWYYHYVFYTIPLCSLGLFFVFWYFLRPRFPRLWQIGAWAVIVASVALGLYTQWAPYHEMFAYHARNQSYASLATYLNTRAPKDCVVLQNTLTPPWDTFITAFTHCNYYISGERLLIAPTARFTHNYLVLLRLRGVGAAEIETYLAENRDEAAGHLYFQLQYSLGAPDPRFDALYAELPRLYREFLKRDFRAELAKYRIDYLLAAEPLPPRVRGELGALTVTYEKNGVVLYKF